MKNCLFSVSHTKFPSMSKSSEWYCEDILQLLCSVAENSILCCLYRPISYLYQINIVIILQSSNLDFARTESCQMIIYETLTDEASMSTTFSLVRDVWEQVSWTYLILGNSFQSLQTQALCWDKGPSWWCSSLYICALVVSWVIFV